MAKILILIGAHICTAPRPQKEAQYLSELGHDVLVGGVWFDAALSARDRAFMQGKPWRFEAALDFRAHRRVQRFLTRAQRRAALACWDRFDFFSPSLLGYGAKRLLAFALRENADLSIVHSEAGLWVGAELLRRGARVGVDFEDWFSEDLPLEARRGRPVQHIRNFEKELLSSCTYRLTTSQCLARALATHFEVSEPAVLYNVFPWAERRALDGNLKDRQDPSIPSLHWFSHTIGRGRGLELLFSAFQLLERDVELHLRGRLTSDIREWILSEVPCRHRARVYFHELVSNEELLSRIAEHDIGLALEEKTLPSRDLTVTNKLFQYLLGGLAVVATDTSGQREVLSHHPDVGRIVSTNSPSELARALEDLLSNRERLEQAKQAALHLAQTKYCFEKHSGVIQHQMESALRDHDSNLCER